MDHFNVKRFALVLAVQAEIEGMKAANMDREQQGHSMAYDEYAFKDKAEQLRSLAYCSDEQL